MQLYYADLVYAGEEDAVKMAMNTFKDQLSKAEASVDDKEAWGALSFKPSSFCDHEGQRAETTISDGAGPKMMS